jgi:DNA-binding CsgD family transcriptional regulator
VATLRQILHDIAQAPSARDLKLLVMDQLAASFGVSANGLYLFGSDGNVSEVHTRGVRDGFILTYEQLGRGRDPILEHALRTGAATHDGVIYPGDQWRRSTLYRECGGPWQIQHYLCVPILVGGRIAGTLNLGRRSEAHPFGRDDSARATVVCRAIAARLEALAAEPEGAAAPRPTIEDFGRQRAERTQVRMHAAALERQSLALADEQAGALWDAVLAGRVAPLDCFDAGDRTYLLLPNRSAPSPPRRPLTRREAEVVGRVAAGLANKEIAFELGISLNTVGSALLSARQKLGVGSRVELVATARRLGLAP